MIKEDLITNIYNMADSIYLNEPELTDICFKYMTNEQLKAVEKEIKERMLND